MAAALADVPIPSIEVGEQVREPSTRIPRSLPSTLSRSTSPSATALTPATSPNRDSAPAQIPSNNEAAHEHQGAQYDQREGSAPVQELAALRLSPPAPLNNMGDLAGALDQVAQIPSVAPAPRARSASLQPETPQQRYRSRSASIRVEVPRYQVGDEEGPDDRFFSAEFQQAFRDAKTLMANMEGALGSSTLHLDEGSTIHRLQREASELARYQYPTTKKVGFVGDTGAGKY